MFVNKPLFSVDIYFILNFNKKGQHKGQVCLGIELRDQ